MTHTPRKTLRSSTVAKINAKLTLENSPVSITCIHGDFFIQTIAPDTGMPLITFKDLRTKDEAESAVVECQQWHAERVGKRRVVSWSVIDVARPRFAGEGNLVFYVGTDGQITTDVTKAQRMTKSEAYAKASQMNPGNGRVNFDAAAIEEWI
jgi:hypothetical protein